MCILFFGGSDCVRVNVRGGVSVSVSVCVCVCWSGRVREKLWDGEEPLILIQNSKMSSLVRARSLLSKLNTSLARGLASKPPWLISSKLKGQNHVGSFFPPKLASGIVCSLKVDQS